MNKSKYYSTKDTVIIYTETSYTLKFSKKEFNQLIDKHSELLSDKDVFDPDLVYHCSGNDEDFGSEAGQDNYYILYAFFLKQKNGIDKYAATRKKLIGIYSAINSLFDRIENGGTYFGHQDARILGYTEFSIHRFIENEKYFSKTYDYL